MNAEQFGHFVNIPGQTSTDKCQCLCTDFDTADVQCYEEVRRMAPFQRRVLVLVGPHGVGRRSLKERLIKDDPRRFGAVMPRK